jgi:hypothetical protein
MACAEGKNITSNLGRSLCSKHYRYIHADSPEATKLLNDNLLTLLNADKPKAANGVVDGIILWECIE